jgi:hypothetical protein
MPRVDPGGGPGAAPLCASSAPPSGTTAPPLGAGGAAPRVVATVRRAAPSDFGRILQRRRDGPVDPSRTPAPPELAGLPAWQRHEGPARAPPRAPITPVGSQDRLLIGFGAGGAEARLRIGGGPLAGAEIHLRQGPGGQLAIEATVLTRLESSRQTLSLAMEEVARRLARRGYTLRIR